MDFEFWEPYYERILKDFGFSRAEDERAAKVLDRRLGGTRIDPKELAKILTGKRASVAGNAPTLKNELGRLTKFTIAADEATSTLVEAGLLPDVIVTDLDGQVEDQLEANRRGSIAVLHAHGDNIPAIEKWADRFEGQTMATTQSTPLARVHNFGGFTDGDRGVFLADAMGAKSIRLVGFDFEHPNPKDEPAAMKKRKLDWAFILIESILAERVEF
ncbi:MAG TPA: 6-hydroxymethylpterin diphosphokinase MptE-like protein [Thermoplasmata archaeon]|nr:6-hydroxymethylpterin diphosphokinase MptE-like protein [Thermoplasmata archaeon]